MNFRSPRKFGAVSVRETLKQFDVAGLGWPLPDDVTIEGAVS
jgi:hypothetical protein